jgi:hypothetical protein
MGIIMPVTDAHPEYIDKIDTWTRIDNVLNGKAKKYIPDIEPIFNNSHPLYDVNRTNLARRTCKIYREGAVFINFAAQSLAAITALALNCPATKEDFPPQLEYLRKDSTGNKLTFDQLKQKLLRRVLSVGRVCLFTDYPNVDPTLDRATQQSLKLVPRMYVFDAECVHNWKTKVVNGVEKLSQVVIRKAVPDPTVTDKYSHKTCLNYLVLELDENGYYCQYQLGKDGITLVIPPFNPLAAGKKFTNIPFTFIGSEDNDPKCDACPLETIVELNIGHLRNSAIYEDNLKKYGRGTLTVTSSLQDFAEYYKNRPLILGTEEGYYLGESGAFTIAQLQPAQEAAVAMTQKQDQIIMAGGHIVVSNPTNISTDTTKLNMSEKVSILNTSVGNIEDALNEHIGYCDMYMGGTPKPVYLQLSREFISRITDPLVMGQLLAAINGGALPRRIYLEYCQSVGLLPAQADIDSLLAEADTENPFPEVDTNNYSNFGN